MPHPPEVVARIKRVLAFHESTKVMPPEGSVYQQEQQPSFFRVFNDCPRTPLPTRMLDAPVSTLRVMTSGVSALPESLVHPPQELKTLATWLHLAAGITGKTTYHDRPHFLRSSPSAGALFPCELYVLALGIHDLQPGLYHFSPKDFSLHRLRDGVESLSQLKRGRPDLDILKTMPAVILVSTIFWRSAWKYANRGYRYANLDAGHLIENLVQTGTGLGIQTMVRLHLNEKNTRELIGLPRETSMDQFEAVQGFVAWADKANNPLQLPQLRAAPPALAPLPRPAVSASCTDYPEIRAVHDDCVAPGVGVHEVRPPYTDRCPLPEGTPHQPISAEPVSSELSLFQTLQRRRSVRQFDPHGISRDQFATLNRLAFRGGTYYPLLPSGPHLAITRPFWFVHGVNGLTPGVWYYHANHDQFTPVRYGELRFDTKYLFGDQLFCGEASAVCVMVADLRHAMNHSCPDAYRLAHLEAGIAGQRLYLACTALDIQCCAAGSFLDDELCKALDLHNSDYQCIYGFAVGGLHHQAAAAAKEKAAAAPTGRGIGLR